MHDASLLSDRTSASFTDNGNRNSIPSLQEDRVMRPITLPNRLHTAALWTSLMMAMLLWLVVFAIAAA